MWTRRRILIDTNRHCIRGYTYQMTFESEMHETRSREGSSGMGMSIEATGRLQRALGAASASNICNIVQDCAPIWKDGRADSIGY